MSEKLKIQGKYLTAGETAQVLGVPKQRAARFVTMLKRSGSTSATVVQVTGNRLPPGFTAKKKSVSGTHRHPKTVSSPVTKGAAKPGRAVTIGKHKEIGVAKPAYSALRPVTESSRKATARRYAPKRAVAKKS